MKTFRNAAAKAGSRQVANAKARDEGALRREPCANHVVHFYDEHHALADNACAFLAGGLLRGAPAVVIVAADRRDLFCTRLSQMGIDLVRATGSRQLVMLDAEETLERLLVDGAPNEAHFREVIAAQIAGLIEIWRPSRLHAYGDMVDVLFARGQQDAAIGLEALWDELASRLDFSLYCAYDGRQLAKENDRAAFDAVCRYHGQIVPMAGVGTGNEGAQPMA